MKIFLLIISICAGIAVAGKAATRPVICDAPNTFTVSSSDFPTETHDIEKGSTCLLSPAQINPSVGLPHDATPYSVTHDCYIFDCPSRDTRGIPGPKAYLWYNYPSHTIW